MTVRKILHYPDPQLRIRAQPVTQFDDALQVLIDDMVETMYAAQGVGLAATQINVHRRVVVMDVTDRKESVIVMINPELLSADDKTTHDEGCLSVPGAGEKVTRAARVKVRALDREGKSYELEAEGLLAICIQHEIDHINGKLYIDHLSSLKRRRAVKTMEKHLRRHPDE